MPQLDKFTYFTQFFWSCLLLFTFDIAFFLYLLVGRKERISGLRNESSKTKRTGLFQMRLSSKGSKLYILFLYWLLKPLVRFTMGFAFFFLISNLFRYGNVLMEVFPSFLLSFDSIEYNSGSSSGWTSFDIGVLLEPEPMPPLETFRAQNAHIEEALFSRIRNLEADLVYGIPPQLNEGEYEAIVREMLTQGFGVHGYQSALRFELFEITILELKANLQNQLFNVMLAEPDDTLSQILSQSPFDEKNIRPEAYEYIEEQVKDLSSARHHRPLLEAALRSFLQDVQQNGHLSAIYRGFLNYFVGNF